ncbi:MAG: hypothetical protein JWN94_134 [Betaproteobacteria bacterium]|nr:hypothetical protein [Betaproteobacteria bacterium]
MQIRSVDASHGWLWLTQGLALFRRNPAQWVFMIGLLFVGSRLLLTVPYLGLIVVLLTPNFLAGLTHGAQALSEGKPLRFGYLASGFLKNAGRLVTLGAVTLMGHFVMLLAMTTVAGAALSDIVQTMGSGAVTAETVAAMRTAAPRLLLSVAVGLGVALPVMLAVWFAPMLVFFDDLKPVPAMIASLWACLRNLLPLLVYTAAVMVPLFILMQIGVALTRQPDMGIWLLAPVLVPSLYVSYRDLFVAAPAE